MSISFLANSRYDEWRLPCRQRCPNPATALQGDKPPLRIGRGQGRGRHRSRRYSATTSSIAYRAMPASAGFRST